MALVHSGRSCFDGAFIAGKKDSREVGRGCPHFSGNFRVRESDLSCYGFCGRYSENTRIRPAR
jgi:hypothetical protein